VTACRLEYAARYFRRLEDIHEYISQQNPAAARPGRVAGTRELVIVGTPYIVPYRVKADVIQIITVLHGAQRWPDRLP
jgi:toxin ParE1/3/4